MQIGNAKRLASDILDVGQTKIWVDPTALEKVTEAITKDDIRQLIKDRIVRKSRTHEHSKGRARVLREKKKWGRKSGKGKRTGTKKARMQQHKRWIGGVRALRMKLKELKEKKLLKGITYGKLYRMIKGNYFRGKAHLEAFAQGKKI